MVRHIESIGHRLGFTRNEALAVVFLALITGAGALLHELRSDVPAQTFREAYAAHDSTFAVLSAKRLDRQAADSSEHGAKRDEAPAEPLQRRVHVDINLAGETELTTLPGVGPATAKKIIAYRINVGKFEKIEDIMQVKSIGRKKFERMKELIYVK